MAQLKTIAEKGGVSQSAVIEILIDELAKFGPSRINWSALASTKRAV